MTDKTSQAFIKELVFRAVQVATQNGSGDVSEPAGVKLTNEAFDAAYAEMSSAGGKSAKRIIGFHAEV